MKKFFTLALLALGLSVGTAQAQVRKTWDFTQGISAETIADLVADSKWTVAYNDDGSFKQANEASKLSGEFIANGNVIKELSGLKLGTAGLSNTNNVIIFPKRFRMNRNKEELIFPKLRNGQTVTIVGRSANATAEDRGIKASYDYLQLIEGPGDCLIRSSLGEVTLKWQVVTEETDSVDVKFTMITGGVDFTLFQIDEGDVPQQVKVGYLYDGSENDPVLSFLQNRDLTEVEPVNVTSATVTSEQLQGYDVTVIGASVPADNAAVAVLKEAMPWTPMLNLNAQLYNAWGYGEAVESSAILVAKNAKHKLFEGVEIINSDGFNGIFLDDNWGSAQAVKPGDYFAGDDILANPINDESTGGDASLVAIHQHNSSHNSYMYIAYTPDYNQGAYQILDNALNLLQATKAEITPATVPTISKIYKDRLTKVIIKAPAQPKARVFYTTDGTAPTTASTEYTDTISITEHCTLRAAAIAEGFTLSAEAKLDVLIKDQPKQPTLTTEPAEGHYTITRATETAGATIWYNFVGAADTLKSTRYADTLDVVITMPQTVTAFTTTGTGNEAVFSEVTTQRVLVQNPRVVIDVAAHFAAAKWDGVENGKGMFSWGASAASMYTGEGTIGEDPQTGDEIIIYTDDDLRDFETVKEPGDNPEWVLKSRGTCLIWQNTGAQTTNFGQDSNYNPIASTDVDPLFPVTKNDIQFYKFQAGEPVNGSIETINKYQAPLDVVVLANMTDGPLVVQVSADGESWTTIGEIAKTGYARMWGKSQLSYNGTDEVFVRVTEEVAAAGPKVFDIYIANQGEKSQALLDEINQEYTGIQIVSQPGLKPAEGIYSINGTRLHTMQRGLNIVVGQDGQVRKVFVK